MYTYVRSRRYMTFIYNIYKYIIIRVARALTFSITNTNIHNLSELYVCLLYN